MIRPGEASGSLRSTILLACASVIIGCGQPPQEIIVAERAVPVGAEAAQTTTLRTRVVASGVVTAAPGAEFIVTAPEHAQIAELRVNEGDLVRRGDLLVRFEDRVQSAQAGGRQAEVDRAEAQLVAAKTTHTRARDLFERGLIPRNQVEEADREVVEAERALEYARAALNESSVQAERLQIRATFDGVVARLYHETSDLVQPSAEDPVLAVIDPRRLEVEAQVPLLEVSRIAAGSRARVLGGTGGEAEWLTVVSIPPVFDPGVTSAVVRLACMPNTRLAAGVPVQIEIEGEERPDTIIVPVGAVVREDGEVVVFVVEDGVVQRRHVTIGIADRGYVEVRSGVAAGELVITRGQAELSEGMSVIVMDDRE